MKYVLFDWVSCERDGCVCMIENIYDKSPIKVKLYGDNILHDCRIKGWDSKEKKRQYIYKAYGLPHGPHSWHVNKKYWQIMNADLKNISLKPVAVIASEERCFP